MNDPVDLRHDYLLLHHSELEQTSGGEEFWQRLGTDDEFQQQVGESWLIASFEAAASWDRWEIHPHADEVVQVTAGHLIFTFDRYGKSSTVKVTAGRTVIVPAGVWHTVDVIEPGAITTITFGRGTKHRPR